MKKSLLTLVVGMALALTAGAAVPGAVSALRPSKGQPQAQGHFQFMPIQDEAKAPIAAPQKVSGSLDYSLAGEPYTWLGFNNLVKGNQMATAFEITPEVSSKFAGAEITAISFYTGINGNTNKNDILLYSGFVTEGDLPTGPVAEGQTEVTPVSESGISATQAQKLYTIKLAKSVKIEAGKRYYVGTRFTIAASADYPVAIDYEPTSNLEGGWFAVRANGDSSWQWDNLASQYGNICLSCTLTGGGLPENYAVVAGINTTPVVRSGEKFDIDITVKNDAANTVSSIEYTYKIGAAEPVAKSANFSKALNYGETASVTVSGASTTETGMDVPVTVTVTKVNGLKNNAIEEGETMTETLSVIPADKGYTRNVVIEEATGNWCQWCPYGMIVMDHIHSTYTDGTFATIAVHGGSSTEPMQTSSYNGWMNAYISGFPTAIINRMYEVSLGYMQASNDVDQIYSAIRDVPGLVDLSMECRWGDAEQKSVQFDTKTSYVWDYDKAPDYLLSYVITENNVGPYNQTNGLAGQTGNYGGWEKKGRSVSMLFEDVARILDTFEGIPGSVPSAIVAGQEYGFTHIVDLPTSVKSAAEITAICMVINTKTGIVENVKYLPASQIKAYDPSGITEAAVEKEDAPVEYFNLQGMRVENPAGGVFIRRQGNTVTKVVK
ncbi:MAG: hypothetical protein NC039_03200 [Muribaculaceae bacterium]|nr:hypothetical protein [Muribaculaceae bacterium]